MALDYYYPGPEGYPQPQKTSQAHRLQDDGFGECIDTNLCPEVYAQGTHFFVHGGDTSLIDPNLGHL